MCSVAETSQQSLQTDGGGREAQAKAKKGNKLTREGPVSILCVVSWNAKYIHSHTEKSYEYY